MIRKMMIVSARYEGAGPEDIEELVTHEFPLDQMNEAMDVNMKQLGIKIAYVAK